MRHVRSNLPLLPRAFISHLPDSSLTVQISSRTVQVSRVSHRASLIVRVAMFCTICLPVKWKPDAALWRTLRRVTSLRPSSALKTKPAARLRKSAVSPLNAKKPHAVQPKKRKLQRLLQFRLLLLK